MQTSKILFKAVTLALATTLIVSCSKEAKKTRFLSEADNYFKAGDYDKAKVSYLNVIRLDPQNALAFRRIGAIWLDDAAFPRGIAFLERATELDPENTENRIRLARCYLALGQFTKAKAEALKILNQVPDNGDALIAVAESARSKDDIQTAAQQLERYRKKDDISFHIASANLLLNSGDFSGAESALREALAVDPGSSASHMTLGDLYLLKKDLKQAGEEFRKAADFAPVRSIERLKYAAFALGIGDNEETRRIATDMTKRAPDYLPGWTLLAQLALNDKKYDEALLLLENVFSRDPQYIDGRRTESDVLLAKGDTKKAVEILEQLDQTYPDTPLIKYGLARAYLANNNTNQAKVTLDQAVSVNPNFTDAIVLLAETNLRSGHGGAAIEPLTDLLKRKPDLKEVALLLAAAHGSLDRFDDAAAVIGEQARLAPQDSQLQMALGLTYRQAKRNSEARHAFERAAELSPDALWPVDQLIELDLLEQHFDAARRKAQARFQKTPDSPISHFYEGKILAAEQQWEPAVAELKKTLLLDPNFTGAYELLVQGYVATNKIPEALSQLQLHLATNPDDTSALMTLGLLSERTNDFTKARDAYEKVLASNPTSVLALNNLANLYTDRIVDLDKAYELARKAHELKHGDPAVADTFGWVLSKRGEYQRALPILQESAAKLPDSPEVQFHLGMTAYMMGQTELARVALQKAASAPNNFRAKEESKRRLALLENDGGASSQLSIEQLEAMTSEQPNDVVSQMRLGEAYEKQGASERAAAAFERALKLNPNLTAAVIKLAELFAGPLHNNEKALTYAKRARELAPTDPRVASILGKVVYESGNFTWSYSLLQEAARVRTDDLLVLHQLAWAAYGLGKINEARDLMQKVLTTGVNSPQAADAKKFLFWTTLDENSTERAALANEIQKELKADPVYLPVLMAEAALDQQHGQTKPASEIYTAVLHRLPNFAPAQKHLAMLYARDPSAADTAYDLAVRARKTLPDDAELAELLGRLSYKKQEYQRAIQLLQESARKHSLDADSLFYLGMSQLQSGQKEEAPAALNRALIAGLQEPLASEAKRALADIQRH